MRLHVYRVRHPIFGQLYRWGGTYWFVISCYVYQEFYDPGDGVSVGGNLDFYRDDTNWLEAIDTPEGDKWYRWQGVISVSSGNKIFPKFDTRSRAENYDHYGDHFWSDAYSSDYCVYGFHADLYEYS